MNLNDYTETVLYTNGDFCNYDGLLDLDEIYPGLIGLFTDGNSVQTEQVALDENTLYLIGTNTVTAVELKTGTSQTFLEDEDAEKIQYAAGGLYYINRDNFLMRLDVQTGGTRSVYEEPVSGYKALAGSVLAEPYASENCVLILPDGSAQAQNFKLPDIAVETTESVLCFAAQTVQIINKQTLGVTQITTAAFPITADETAIYAMETTEQGNAVVVYDYTGKEICRSA